MIAAACAFACNLACALVFAAPVLAIIGGALALYRWRAARRLRRAFLESE